MKTKKKLAKLKTQIGQLLLDLQALSSEADRQACLLLIEKTLRKYYGLKQTTDNGREGNDDGGE